MPPPPPVEVTCPDGHPMSTTARRRSVRCRCGRVFYVRSDGTTREPPAQPDGATHPIAASPGPAPVEPAPGSLAPQAPEPDPSTTPRPRRQVRRMEYDLPPAAPPAPARPVPPATPEPASPAAPVPAQAPTDTGPGPDARRSTLSRLRAGWRSRAAASAQTRRQRDATHPYADVLGWD